MWFASPLEPEIHFNTGYVSIELCSPKILGDDEMFLNPRSTSAAIYCIEDTELESRADPGSPSLLQDYN